MRKNTLKESIAPKLDDLLNDDRLARLFSKDVRDCALQLWVLQIKSEQTIENRVVYGRLLPYSYSNDRWSSSDNDNFQTFGPIQAQVIRLNLYLKSFHCADLLRQLSAGKTISAVSEGLKLDLSDRFKERFGAIALATDDLIYRPVAYLLNRDAYDQHSPSSPHGGAGAFSASITQADKVALFRVGQGYDVALTASLVQLLNADTGLDFGRTDIVRFGDIELLVFPAMDELERCLLNVSWTEARYALVARFNPMQIPHFSGFQFRLSIANNGQIVYSGIATAERDAENIFECKFELSDQLRARTDSTELEIFGFHGDHPREGTLCCRWRVAYVREINLQGHVLGQAASPVKFDWLERTAHPSASARVNAALTIQRGNLGFANHVGVREADPWVPANRDLVSIFEQIHPPKSEGRFFPRWGQSDGEGRLQFVEWFRALLTKYPQHQVVIIDPYFESAGLGLVILCAAPGTDYIVFRSIPKKTVKKCETAPEESGISTPTGMDNLMANCEQNHHLLKKIKLRIYGLKEGRLHDRYILIIGADKLPVVGFNLSNSLQAVAQEHPMLITPIPADVLLKVEQYQSELVQEALAAQVEGETENPPMRLLFNSTASPTAPQSYEPPRFLEKTLAGDVLSAWAGEPSLQGLSGDSLRERLTALSLLKNDSLVLPGTGGLRNCLEHQMGNFADFTATWEVLGEVLAHSRTEDSHYRELKSEHAFLEFLEQFLKSSFDRAHNEVNQELTVMDARLFRNPVETFLYSSSQVPHFSRAIKYTVLTWSEHYTIKFLWWYAPAILLTVAETQVASLPMEPQGADAMKLSLLSQIIGEISLSVQFDISEEQRNRLIRSGNGLLQWMGLNAIKRQLEVPGGVAAVQQLVAAFTHAERVRALGWMVNHTAKDQKTAEIHKDLVTALHESLPATIPAGELRRLIDSMRGHMRQLAWAEPWLFQDVIFPLLQNGRTNFDDACEIWVQELARMLEPQIKSLPRLFDRAREGQTTNITAFLFANSGPERQQASLKSMQAILKRQQQIVQRPLASTSDWTQWDGALVVLMWILTFTRWGLYYLRQRGITNPELDKLSQQARELAMIRPIDEWRSKDAGGPGQLAAFLDQVEELLASSDEPKCDVQ